MNYIVITDYPYDTLKKFFNNKEEALSYTPNQYSGWKANRLLDTRIYEIESYSEKKIDNRTIINYQLKLDEHKNPICFRKPLK